MGNIKRKESEVVLKKIFLVLIMIATLLCACQPNKDTGISDYHGDIAKAQEIEAVSADTLSVVETITDQEDIDAFVLTLDMDEWKLVKLPEDAKKTGDFTLSQEKTTKLWESENDGEMYDVCKLSVYDSPYIDFEIEGLSMTFEVSEETANYLNEYFQ